MCATCATVTQNLSLAWQANQLAARASETSGTLEAYRGNQAGPNAKREAGGNPKTTCVQRPHAASVSDGRFAPSDAAITRWRSAPAADRGEA